MRQEPRQPPRLTLVAKSAVALPRSKQVSWSAGSPGFEASSVSDEGLSSSGSCCTALEMYLWACLGPIYVKLFCLYFYVLTK